MLVHDTTFYCCEKCNIRTKTAEALDYHIKRKHELICNEPSLKHQQKDINVDNVSKDEWTKEDVDCDEFSDNDDEDGMIGDVVLLWIT